MFYFFSGLTIISGFILFMRIVYLISGGESWYLTFLMTRNLIIFTIILAVATMLVHYFKKKK